MLEILFSAGFVVVSQLNHRFVDIMSPLQAAVFATLREGHPGDARLFGLKEATMSIDYSYGTLLGAIKEKSLKEIAGEIFP